MSSPKWHPENLQKHYKKRLRYDDHCWQDLLNISRSMTKAEYEQESSKVYSTGSLEYEAEYERHGPSLYRVDKRAVLAVASQNRKKMITCFHRHYNGKHESGSTTPSLEHLLTFIDDIDASLDVDIEKLFRIEPVKENLSKNQLRKYIAPKLKPLQGKCIKYR